MPDILVGRQPIFDRRQQIFAYELLYRSPDTSAARDGDQATMQVVLNTFAGIGLDQLVGEQRAFINFTRNFLVGHIPIPFPPGRIVLEVLEDIVADTELIASLHDLARQGYWIALDDVISSAQAADLVHLAHIVKIDILGMDRTYLAQLVAYFRHYGVKLLAEKVETLEDLQLCRRLGFDYFQGYFLCRPAIVSGRRLDSSQLVLLRLLAQVQDPATDFRQLGRLIAQDVTLSYKLLKLVNSAYYQRRDPITSIEQAVSIIGLNYLRGWLTLLHMAESNRKPPELITIALIRARMCERLARALNLGAPDTFFLTGLLSVLDALMDYPMPAVLADLPLAQPVKDGLLGQPGPTGQVLQVVMAHERGDWSALSQLPLSAANYSEIFVESIGWARRLLQGAQAPAP